MKLFISITNIDMNLNEEPSRDKIRHRERAQQINSFENMNFSRRAIPTDIDGFLEFDGKLFINFEGKYKGKEMMYGQRLSFEHLVQSHKRGGDAAFVILYEHTTPCNEDVVVGEQLVTKVYDSRFCEWRTPTRPIRVQEAIDMIIKYAVKHNIIKLN